jgi:hypothetical protein
MAQLINFLLIILPGLCCIITIWYAPDASKTYMVTLLLFALDAGYTTLAMPLAMLVIAQGGLTIFFFVSEAFIFRFNPSLRPAALLCENFGKSLIGDKWVNAVLFNGTLVSCASDDAREQEWVAAALNETSQSCESEQGAWPCDPRNSRYATLALIAVGVHNLTLPPPPGTPRSRSSRSASTCSASCTTSRGAPACPTTPSCSASTART